MTLLIVLLGLPNNGSPGEQEAREDDQK